MILHVDGDAFFASCEVARDPRLRGRPVVVGGLRGIAVALTYEAKARGVVRGMPMFQIRQLCPDVVVLPGDYELYSLMAKRMYAIVRRFAGAVEEYSIDECFADVTNSRTTQCPTYTELGAAVKRDLEGETGVSFSVGVAPTKVLSKIASKFRKPSGMVSIDMHTRAEYLAQTAVGKLWGVGRATTGTLMQQGITTALQLANQTDWWVARQHKPLRFMHAELNGVSVYPVVDVSADLKSTASTRTFRPPSSDRAFLRAQLSHNIEEACTRARTNELVSSYAYCFLKSQDFQYRRFEVPLPRTNAQGEVASAVLPLFERAFVPGIMYRATGITLAELSSARVTQGNLFDNGSAHDARVGAMHAYDDVRERFGKGSIFLASSMLARKHFNIKTVNNLQVPDLGECT